MSSKKRRASGLSRKQIVWIEWAVLFTVLAALAAGTVFLLFSGHRRAGKGADAPAQAADEGSSALQQDAEPRTAQTEAMQSESEASARGGNPDSFLLSFAGDCTIGSLLEWQGSLAEDFQSVVGTDYAYPLSGVREIFSQDDLTVVNLEGTFTTSGDAVVKPYRFRADPAYVKVLTEGSVEAVSTANNHSGDFREDGLADTIAALDGAGIQHTGAGDPLICKIGGGCSVGIVSYNTVDNPQGEAAWRASVQADIDTCRQEGCALIIGFMHWGSVEYLPEPEAWEVQLAHDMADWGCGLIVGGHAHILQRMEIYNDVPIFYSMGNFCYGGNTNPDDKDSVIVQARYAWNAETGKAERTDLSVIPCLISSTENLNDYCPEPCEEGSEAYTRILKRLEWTGQ